MKVNKKLIRRIASFCVVAALVVCVGMFSITAYAVDVEAPSEIIYTRITSVRNEWLTTEYKYTYTNVGEMMPWEEVVTANHGIPPGTSYVTIWDFFKIEGSYFKDILVPKGGVTTFSIYNLYLDIGIDYPTGFYYLRDAEHTTTYVEYMDGTYEYTGESVSVTQSDGVYNIIFKFTPKKDVKFVELQLRRTDVVDPANVHSNIHIYSGVKSTVWTYPTISINQLSEEAGMLEGVQDQLADQNQKVDDILTGGDTGKDLMAGGDRLEDAGSGLGDDLGAIQDFEDQYMGQLDDNIDEVVAGADLTWLYPSLAFVQRYLNKIVAGVPSKYLIVFTLPMFFGLFMYIVGHPVRAPRPDTSGDEVTRETFTETQILTGRGAGTVRSTRTVTTSREIGRVHNE